MARDREHGLEQRKLNTCRVLLIVIYQIAVKIVTLDLPQHENDSGNNSEAFEAFCNAIAFLYALPLRTVWDLTVLRRVAIFRSRNVCARNHGNPGA